MLAMRLIPQRGYLSNRRGLVLWLAEYSDPVLISGMQNHTTMECTEVEDNAVTECRESRELDWKEREEQERRRVGAARHEIELNELVIVGFMRR